jgi:hypothetical protein
MKFSLALSSSPHSQPPSPPAPLRHEVLRRLPHEMGLCLGAAGAASAVAFGGAAPYTLPGYGLLYVGCMKIYGVVVSLSKA